jgi:hypothetical protein
MAWALLSLCPSDSQQCAVLLPRWLLNLFHNQIESKFRRELESKVSRSRVLAILTLLGLWP